MARRGAGEGSIYRRKDGRWAAAITVTADGRRRQFYGRTRAQVAAKLADAIQTRQEGWLRLGPDPTLGEYVQSWLDNRRHAITPWTYRGYRTQVRHIVRLLGSVKLAALSPEHVAALVAQRIREGAAPKHVRYCHQCLRTALADAVRTRRLRTNVASRELLGRGVLPKLARYPINPYSQEEVRSFLAAAIDDDLEGLYSLAIRSGMRQAELLGLTWEAVDFEHRRVMVSRSLQRINGILTLTDVKTRSARRPIDLSPEMMELLRAYRARQLALRLRTAAWHELVQDGHPIDLVFTTRNGRPLEARNVTRSFKRFLARHQLREIRFHDLRHTHASLLLLAGEHPKVVQERLGHSSIRITLDTYSHLIPSMQRDAARRFEALLS